MSISVDFNRSCYGYLIHTIFLIACDIKYTGIDYIGSIW